ncbi:MAG TPA: glycine--tRNA ligase, partial [Clostridiales bacterium]|nr:glycine--tRNA ligase [Clostridiales bacterium]
DEIGTPFCITYDFQTKGEDGKPGDNSVTVRFRDSMEQIRLPIDSLEEWLSKQIAF